MTTGCEQSNVSRATSSIPTSNERTPCQSQSQSQSQHQCQCQCQCQCQIPCKVHAMPVHGSAKCLLQTVQKTKIGRHAVLITIGIRIFTRCCALRNRLYFGISTNFCRPTPTVVVRKVMAKFVHRPYLAIKSVLKSIFITHSSPVVFLKMPKIVKYLLMCWPIVNVLFAFFGP